MNANDVLDGLHWLLMKRGGPEFLCSGNGPEFIAGSLQNWMKSGTQPIPTLPGSPLETGDKESFNGMLRIEAFSATWFHSKKQAQFAINVWTSQ